MADVRATQTLLALVRRTERMMVSELIGRLQAAGYREISGAHHPLFENIDPGGTRLTVLAERAGTTHQSMGELVQSLERRGYVERRRDPTDARARLVCLTPAGRKLVRRALLEMVRIESRWGAAWREAGFDGQMRSILSAALAAREGAG